MRLGILTVIALTLSFCSREAYAKITIGTAVPVVAGVTTIAVNGKTLIDAFKHPKKAAKKVKQAIKGK